MMERDILRIVDLVAPGATTGTQTEDKRQSGAAANVKVVRKVLHSLQEKNYLQKETVAELEDFIRDRDDNGGVDDVGSPAADGDAAAALDKGVGRGERNGRGGGDAQVRRPEKRQIEQRIEEDRERHKRLRESIWAVPTVEGEGGAGAAADAEQKRMVDDVGGHLDEDDFVDAHEMAEERKKCSVSHRLDIDAEEAKEAEPKA